MGERERHKLDEIQKVLGSGWVGGWVSEQASE